jgi:hypothetical protein
MVSMWSGRTESNSSLMSFLARREGFGRSEAGVVSCIVPRRRMLLIKERG